MQKLNYFYPNVDTTPQALSYKTDSVIRHMQYQIDSLSKIVHDTQIAHGFFSDALSQNLYFYTTIIGILGLISFGWLTKSLKSHRLKLENKVSNTINEQNKKFEKDNIEMKGDLYDSIFHVRRAMYYVSNTNKSYAIAFKWAVSASAAIPMTKRENVKNMHLKNWINNAILQLTLVTDAGRPKLRSFYKDFNVFIDSINKFEKIDVDNAILVKSLLNEYLKTAFKDDQLPENMTA